MNGDIEVGSNVRYSGTGTVGKVKRLDKRGEEMWARVDTTGLWYNSDALEVVSGEIKQKEWSKEMTLDDIKRSEERKMDTIGRAQEILEVELCESGG